MSFVLSTQQQWHEGEKKMHAIMHSPRDDNPNSPFLTPRGAHMLQTAPLLALGTLDSQGRPWATIWGGEPGFARSIGQSIVGIRSLVNPKFDPVVDVLYEGQHDGEVVANEGPAKMLSGLTIDMENRMRVKLFGRMAAGALSIHEDTDGEAGFEGDIGEAQLVIKIEQSLGNCPKYIASKHITPSLPKPKLVSDSPKLTSEALNLISSADTLFVASANSTYDMDCNIRGGSPGFIRVEPSSSDHTTLIWPEYSGNRLYQTLGNLTSYPKAGLVIPSFTTGSVLYLTGNAEILHGKDASSILPHTNLAVRLSITAARYVAGALPFRGHDTPSGPSPYNPPIRYLATEKPPPTSLSSPTTTTLVSSRRITPRITAHKFSLSTPQSWAPGQHIALSFASDLDMGYSHMRDDDPRSINDDFIRTFTISSAAPEPGRKSDEVEITVRNVGPVTAHLAKYAGPSRRAALEVEVKGFGGETSSGLRGALSRSVGAGFVAAGIGITPLLGQLRQQHASTSVALDLSHLTVFWSLAASDLSLVQYVLSAVPALARRLRLFVTGKLSVETEAELGRIREDLKVASVEQRRLCEEDLAGVVSEDERVREWHLCTGPAMRREVLKWLGTTASVYYEDFGY